MKRICVFCGSSPGTRIEYIAAAEALGKIVARRKIGLVYGGGNVGLMDVLACTALAHGGEVIGVVPRMFADMNLAHDGLSDLRIVETMHERKALMAELSQGFIALPGGIGTLEELVEALTWAQLGLHRKPCGLLNIMDYYSPLIRFLDGAVQEGFLRSEHRAALVVAKTPEEIVESFERYAPPKLDKYLDEYLEGRAG